MEADAEHDFSATAEDELSFHRSQVLKVCDTKSVLAGHVDESLIYFIGVKQGRRSKLVQG
jgi:hypothetical protein